MTPERWKRIEQLYQEARARPPADRPAFLVTACADDEPMRREVESLLNDSASDDGFLAEPAWPMSAGKVATLVLTSMAGASLGGYHLNALLGSGGMGEVYRADDPTLGREVAIKILPLAFTSHPDRLARFEREARMLASLNHLNICGIYGFEEAEGIRFLILELVEGDTLADLIARVAGPQSKGGGLPLGEAIGIARQIADALEAAHDKGIVHRDLKPPNIKITPEGVVKVLDFGLAKAVGGAGSSPDLSNAPPADGARPERAAIGTAAYMSPEQARGLAVDKRTDIWAFGCVLYEMLTGRVTFAGETVSDSIAKILEREPDWSALPATTPASIRRLLARSLVKDPRKRLRDIGDARIELDGADEVLPDAATLTPGRPRANRIRRWPPWAALVALAVAVGAWEVSRPAPLPNPLPSEGFTLLTTWPGSEGSADISPDGKVVAFLASRDGETDVFSSQVGTGKFNNLTESVASLNPVTIQRSVGFSGDSARLWFGIPRQKMDMPWSGGEPRQFLVSGANGPAWSSDDRLVYFNQFESDSLWLADGAGRNAERIVIDWPGSAGLAPHNHNMVWSPDNRWIYFVHGMVTDWNHQTDEMDIWRISPSGGSPERLTYLNAPVTFLAMLDQDTLIFVAPEADGSGSWLWALDVGRLRSSGTWWGADRVAPRRIPTGIDQYTSVSASRDGASVVATKASPTASLWSVPILSGREAGEQDVTRFQVQTERALSPRYARGAQSPLLFYLSASGTGDRVWGFTTKSFEITTGADGHLSETPAPAPEGSRLAIVVREAGRQHVAVMNQDGQGSQRLAVSIDVQGAVDWSPDGKWITAGGQDAAGLGLFVISADGGATRRLISAEASSPIWSPRGDFIVYSGLFSGGSVNSAAGSPLKAVMADGTPHVLPLVTGRGGEKEDLRVSPGGYRFLDETHLVYRPAPESLDFWLFDLVTGERRQLTRLGNQGRLRGFDVTPDGKHILFDRSQQNSDIVLIDRRKR